MHSQIPHRNQIQMKLVIDQKLGNDVTDFVADIHHVESTGQKHNKTWGEGGKKIEK